MASGSGVAFFLFGLGGLAVVVMMLATWSASRAKKPPAVKPPRKTFEHGRKLARLKRTRSTAEALRDLASPSIGRIVSARADESSAEVVVERRKSQPCVQTAGYLAGIFESAWAHEVYVAHPVCAGERGGVCQYVVHREPTSSGPAEAGSSIPGSEGGRRRSPPARAGGG